jgi:hypothetical protein
MFQPATVRDPERRLRKVILESSWHPIPLGLEAELASAETEAGACMIIVMILDWMTKGFTAAIERSPSSIVSPELATEMRLDVGEEVEIETKVTVSSVSGCESQDR